MELINLMLQQDHSYFKSNQKLFLKFLEKLYADEAIKDEKIVAVTAAMTSGTGLNIILVKNFLKDYLMLVLQSNMLLQWLLD